MFVYAIPDFNYAAVFGVCLGIYLIVNLDVIVRDAMTFVKGWRSL